MSVDDIGAEKYGAKPELLYATLSLGDGVLYFEHRNHTGADQFAGINLAKLVEPIIIGAGQGGGELGFHGWYAEEIQSSARVDHGNVASRPSPGVALATSS